eukprot:m.161900 g.161900  ORF g.161900 m.161900 type:complete len:1074 (+) comp38822_c2_seq2:611-3832(+)
MSNVWESVVPKLPAIKEKMAPKYFLDRLLAAGLVTVPEFRYLLHQPTHTQIDDLLVNILPKKDSKAYNMFRSVLKETEEQAFLVKEFFPCDTPGGPPLPSVDDVLRKEWAELKEIGKEMVDVSSYKAEKHLREGLLDFLAETGKFSPGPPPIVAATNLVKIFGEKKRDFVERVESVQQFVKNKDIKPWLEKMGLPKMSFWVEDESYENKKHLVQTEKPLLLIAGSTSCGKSTLLNCLLGEDVLPTAYSAATSVICEIKRSDDPHKKTAIVHLESGSKTLDLSDKEDQEKLRDFITVQYDPETKKPRSVCKNVEVHWPCEFLEHFTLVDSPGVTGTSLSPLKEITEKFRDDKASAIIYVLDATRAPKEASEAGGLLREIKSAVPSGAALFVLNKWDIFADEQRKPQVQDEYVDSIRRQIAANWTGIRSDQLLRYNAKLASKAQKLGQTTDETRSLCKSIEMILPTAMDRLLVKSCSDFERLLDWIRCYVLQTIIELGMPAEERVKKRDKDWENLQQFKKHTLEPKKKAVEEKINEMIKPLFQYLTSDEGTKYALTLDSLSSTRAFVNKDCESAVFEVLCRAVSNAKVFKDFMLWINNDAESTISEMKKKLADLLPFDETDTSESNEAFFETGLTASTIAASALRLLTVIGVTTLTAAAAVTRKPLLATISGTIDAALLPDYGRGSVWKDIFVLRDAIVDFYKWTSFKKQVKALYKSLITDIVKDNDKFGAHIREVAIQQSDIVKTLLDFLPATVDDMEKGILAKARLEEKDVPSYRHVKAKCDEHINELSDFLLRLRIHEFSEAALLQEDGGGPNVFPLLDDGKAVLKATRIVSLTEAYEVKRQIRQMQSISHENVIEFCGSVLLSERPLKVGFLFKQTAERMLSELFSQDYIPAFKQGGLHHAHQLVAGILNGLKYLHGEGIVHRNLSSNTVMLTENGPVKLDCYSFAPENLRNRPPIYYSAPEVLEGQSHTASSDMYSIGILMWEIWHGRPAFASKKEENLREELVGGLHPEKFAEVSSESMEVESRILGVSDQWSSLATSCWSPKPVERISSGQAHEKLGSAMKALKATRS